MNNINEIVNQDSSNPAVRKLKLPKKVLVNDLKFHPVEAKCVGACSDGIVIALISILTQLDQSLGFVSI